MTPEPTLRDDAQVSRFVERLGGALTDAGLARLPSRVFAQLMADDDGRMTAAELTEALQVSPAAISGAVRYLQQVRMISREREKGSRRDVFVVMDDAWHDMMINHELAYLPLREAMAAGIPGVGGPSTPAGARLALSVEFLEFISAEVDGIAARWEARCAERAEQAARHTGRRA
ncbi:MAG TPA: MarR family transcriptional regulator [Dermatophilaceae bacterium]|jgi:DNA-binding transcriptional ArsR family regulator|nr:MarR family transcriptional regulator [Actinomycetales bacterium]HMT31728.1 MarR family transcriptional regulator [Dermatophilaceae bacterium]HMT89338.1 MarR family transcriptional regulator [Dermatophilaceae bacterium]